MRKLVYMAAFMMAVETCFAVTEDLNGKLGNNTRLTLNATFETQGEVQFATGVSNEMVSVTVHSNAKDAKEPAFSWRYKKPVAPNPNAWEYNGKVTLGGRARSAFGWTDSVLQWTDYYKAIQAEVPLAQRTFRITLENHEGIGRLLVNGMLMNEWPVLGDYGTSAFKMSSNGGAKVIGAPEVIAMAQGDELFWPMDLSARYNAKGIAGSVIQADSLPPRNVPFKVGNVPFVIGSSALGGNDTLDVGQSWFREGNFFGTYEEPSGGSFSGRWAGMHSDTPTRLQFRLPNRTPSAMHLLAVSDGRDNSIPRLTAQFYRPSSGFPVGIMSPDVPLATAKTDAKRCWPVKTTDGKTLNLWLVTIPINQGLLQQMSGNDDQSRRYWRLNRTTDRDMLEVEFTKDVQTYREYPDPCHYSIHGAGLPSAVQLFAATMEYPAVEVTFDPDAYGNIWTEPAVPSYTVSLTNRTGKAASAKLRLDSVSHSKTEKLNASESVALKPFEGKTVKMRVPVQRFGHHDLTLKVTVGKDERVFTRSLAHLRKRELEGRPFDAKGFMFGYWNWSGSHATPNADEEVLLMGPLGMESKATQAWSLSEQGKADAIRFGMKDFWASKDHMPYRSLGDVNRLYYPDREKAKAEIREKIEKLLAEKAQNPKLYEPSYVTFFGEPGGINTHGTRPDFYGEEYALTPEQRERFKLFHDAAFEVAKMLREIKPDVKILIPWGDVTFTIPFLEEQDEFTKIIDGAGVDFGFFDRLPEMQAHQSALHRFYQLKTKWDEYKPGVAPCFPVVEGPCVGPVMAGSLTGQQFADSTIRAALMLFGYGVTRHFAICSPVECSNMWGEQHYGGGAISRLPELNPHICYSAMGTLIRHFRWMEFVGWKPTGSLSVFCHHYRDSKTNRDLFVLWTVRGKREVTLQGNVASASPFELYDSQDNIVPLKVRDGKVTLTVDQSPVFLYGPGDSTVASLGAADHSDAVANMSKHTKPLGNMADLLRQDTSPDLVAYHYSNSFPEAIRRFPAEMKAEKVTVPNAKKKNAPALSIGLPPQPKDRGVMPFFSTFVLDKPVTIPGKASHISLWAKGASDWGRVVYVLRDAKGEGWISVGSAGEWNCDDMPCESHFNFDGWRLLRFEMPSHAPYDHFREAGTIYWGSMDDGDRVVDLPLTLEKVYVERRPKAMYVNTLEPADPAPVLLGDLLAEYATADDMGEKAIRLSRVTMPLPPEDIMLAKPLNPIVELEAEGVLEPTRITQVGQPAFEPNGTHGMFFYDEAPGAVTYDIWVSLHPDGKGALQLAKDIRKTVWPEDVRGTRPNTDLYAFIVYKTADGKTSKPSPAFKFRLDSQFGNR